MRPNLLNEVQLGNYYVCFHNGYPGFSYGCPQNPIVLNYKEVLIVNEYLIASLKYDLLNSFDSEDSFDLKLPDEVEGFCQKRVVTLARQVSIYYENDSEKQKAEKEKQTFLSKIS